MFDENKIALQFAAVSDLQHGCTPQMIDFFDTAERGKSCFRQLQEMALRYHNRGLDAVVFAGDIINNAKASQVESFKEVYESVFDPAKVPFVFCLGNHDVNSGRPYTYQDLNMDVYYRIFGNAYRTYVPEDTDLQLGCVHQVVGGYHFLAIDPLDSGYVGEKDDPSGAKYPEESKVWLDRMLAKITAENPDRYVFVATHPMIHGLAYGGDLVMGAIYWYAKELLPILNQYPQVVAFGGHLHFPISDERSIMQDKITGINCGAMSYMAIENGNYRDMASVTVMKDASRVSNGHLVQLDEMGNMRIIRMNFGLQTTIKQPWVLPAPAVDGSHLQHYTKARGVAPNNKPPVLDADSVTVTDGVVTFRSGRDDDQIHYYEIRVTEGETEIETAKLLADSYLYATPAEMKPVWTLKLKEDTYLPGHSYTVTLTAYDSWGLQSNTVTCMYSPVY